MTPPAHIAATMIAIITTSTTHLVGRRERIPAQFDSYPSREPLTRTGDESGLAGRPDRGGSLGEPARMSGAVGIA